MNGLTVEEAQNFFEKELEKETFRGEKLRVLVILVFLALFMLMFLVVSTFFYDRFFSIFNGKISRPLVFIAILSAIIFEILSYYSLKKIGLRNKKSYDFFKYLNSFIEISVPTFILVLQATIFNPVISLFLPGSFLYFIIIILSALRLDHRLCIFTGAVAAIEYILLSGYVLNKGDLTGMEEILIALPHHAGKAFLLLFGGLSVSLVTREIRKNILKSFKSVEERNQVLNMFGQHVSPEVVDKLLNQKTEMESEIKYVCVMFLDIRGFTAYSEKKSPEEVVTYLNSIFDFMIEIVNKHNGIINKFLGDGFMAVFGTPFSNGNDSVNAVKASLEITARIEEEFRAGRIPETRVGIGLHAGNAVTGSIGSSLRKEYTIIGDVVNLASRIEQKNKDFGSQILVSDSVWQSVRLHFHGSDLGLAPVKGREIPVHLYQLR